MRSTSGSSRRRLSLHSATATSAPVASKAHPGAHGEIVEVRAAAAQSQERSGQLFPVGAHAPAAAGIASRAAPQVEEARGRLTLERVAAEHGSGRGEAVPDVAVES